MVAVSPENATSNEDLAHCLRISRRNSSVVIPGREEIAPFVGHLIDQAVFAIDPA